MRTAAFAVVGWGRFVRNVLGKRALAGPLVVALVVLLAIVETAVALVAPHLAPSDADWRAAAGEVRAGFQPGDLIVAAPAWADPILRLHLGDLIPQKVAGRLDDARFGRVWEVSQRGAHAPAAGPGRAVLERSFGALTVRRVERPAATVSYDFVSRWTDARVAWRGPDGVQIACPDAGGSFRCPKGPAISVRRQLAEVDTSLREAVVAQPLPGATLVIEYPGVRLGRTIEIGTGLHNVWMRKQAQGPVDLRVVIGTEPGTTIATFRTLNDDGWKRAGIDTSTRAGQVAPVRFEISSPAPEARFLALAAEARE